METDRSLGAGSMMTVPPPPPALPCADRSAAPNRTAPTMTTGFARITRLLRGNGRSGTSVDGGPSVSHTPEGLGAFHKAQSPKPKAQRNPRSRIPRNPKMCDWDLVIGIWDLFGIG